MLQNDETHDFSESERKKNHVKKTKDDRQFIDS